MSTCDHTSVGIVVWRDGKLLLIERAREPFGFALPAGHADGDTYEVAAAKELKEEVGLSAETLTLLAEGRKNNPCRRVDGAWHYWKIYEASVTGELARSLDETKQARWLSPAEIQELAVVTEKYLRKEMSDTDWAKNPGLEPIMYEWFTQLKILK